MQPENEEEKKVEEVNLKVANLTATKGGASVTSNLSEA